MARKSAKLNMAADQKRIKITQHNPKSWRNPDRRKSAKP
jgi:hypothetical protein